MKKIILCLFALFITLNSKAEKIKGQIVYENRTVNVIFKVPLIPLTQRPYFLLLQKKIWCLDAQGKEYEVFPEKDGVKELRFKFKDQEIRLLSRHCPFNGGSIFLNNFDSFLQLVVDGNAKLFIYNNGMTENDNSFVVQKANKEVVKIKVHITVKELAEYFSDCPELAKKIEDKELGKKDMVAIVDFYNSKCSQ